MAILLPPPFRVGLAATDGNHQAFRLRWPGRKSTVRRAGATSTSRKRTPSTHTPGMTSPAGPAYSIIATVQVVPDGKPIEPSDAVA
jgi:hypothetical protein